MKEADAVELVEKTSLAGLADLTTDVVYTHVDFLGRELPGPIDLYQRWERQQWSATEIDLDRKSTRLNSSHANISYAVLCLKKKKMYNDCIGVLARLCSAPISPTAWTVRY